MKITKRQDDILVDLFALLMMEEGRKPRRRVGWATPMHIGGTDQSHHGATLRQLVARKLVVRQRRGTLANVRGGRGSYEYRITWIGCHYITVLAPQAAEGQRRRRRRKARGWKLKP